MDRNHTVIDAIIINISYYVSVVTVINVIKRLKCVECIK